MALERTTASAADPCERAACKAAEALGFSTLKEEQMRVIAAVLRGRDVFAVLPTGFGKTLCYAVLPAAFDFLDLDCPPSIVLVVSPLVAIMRDQASAYYLRCVHENHSVRIPC